MYVADTIAAIATASGPGAIGIIRVSGPEAESIARAVVRRSSAIPWDSHHLYHGQVISPRGTVLDDALAVLMRSPGTFTGEDVLELHCHGSPAVLRSVLSAVLNAGARGAEPGEFTRRAFVNGRIDLAQAEAVHDLVLACTDEAADNAAKQLDGRLSHYLAEVRALILRARAFLEVQLDFGDEGVDLDDVAFAEVLTSAIGKTNQLLATFAHGRLLRDGLRVTLTGLPNAGKSSLLNALISEDRAIVSATPGTTRDLIEVSANFQGIPVILTDSAGLRDATDEAEQIGVERARLAAQGADVVLLVIDGSTSPHLISTDHVFANRTLIAFNKTDLPSPWTTEARADLEALAPTFEISARTGSGLGELRQAIISLVVPTRTDGLPIITRQRQRDALEKAAESMRGALLAIQGNVPPDLIAVDVQAALDHIGSVTGVVSSEEVLDLIFSEFCIGK